MSTTILIADDEYFIRQRIKKIIPWDTLNLELSGEAENGQEVLDLLHKHKVDIVILDIRMPKMLGTETALHIHKNFPDTQIIILSGYSEFEYARSALQNGVSDYLLKPVDQTSLCAAIEKCLDKLSVVEKAARKLNSFDRQVRCNALADVRDGKMPIKQLYLTYPDYTSFKYSTYIGIYTKEDTSMGILNLAKKLVLQGLNCEHFQESAHIYVIQLFFLTGGDIRHLGSLLTEFVSSENTYIFATANDVFPLNTDWGFYYKRIVSSLNQRYFHPRSELFMEFQHKEPGSEKIDLIKLRQTVMEYLNLNDAKGFEAFIDKSFSTIVAKKSIDILYAFINELFITFQIYYKIPPNLECSISDFISAMIEEEHAAISLQEAVLHYGYQCINLKKALPSDVSYCKKICTYIENNYGDPTLTVSAIAAHFQLNASYMGTVFKNVKDQSILSFMTKIRIEAAKKLLATNQILVSEVAAAVGYSDVFYFSKCFKKNFGCSPKEFMRTCEALETETAPSTKTSYNTPFNS